MTDTPPDIAPDTEPDDLDNTTAAPDTDTDTTDTEPDTVDRAELLKVIAQRDKIKAELRAIKDKDKPNTEPDPADTLRTALRRTAAVSVLAGRGIVDKDEQAAVLSVMHLDALDIGEDGEVDTDNLADTLDTLGRIFGKGKDKRTAPAVDTRRGSGDEGDALDADTKRYRRVIKGR